MRKLCSCIAKLAFVIAVIFGSAGVVNSAEDLGQDFSNDCGLYSLYLLLRSETSRPIDLSELRRSLPNTTEQGLSMADLIDGARHQGVRLRGLRFRLEDAPLDRSAIAWLRQGDEPDGHFVLLKPVGETGTMVMVLDFPSPNRVLDYADLTASPQWTGRILISEDRNKIIMSNLMLVGGLVVLGWSLFRFGRLSYFAKAKSQVVV